MPFIMHGSICSGSFVPPANEPLLIYKARIIKMKEIDIYQTFVHNSGLISPKNCTSSDCTFVVNKFININNLLYIVLMNIFL